MADLTTTASIRAVLGVSEKEIRDTVLLDPVYRVQLTEHLHSLHEDLVADYDIAEAASPRSALQQRFYDLVQLYSAYYTAKICSGAVAMFAPVTIKEARSELTRQDDPYRELRRDILATLPILKTGLMTVYNRINTDSPLPTAVERIRVLAAPLATDPVTG